MRMIIALLLVAIYLTFCGLLVFEGHWIAGALLALMVMCGVTVKA